MELFIGVPIIIVWVVGFPLFIFIKLVRNRERLNDSYIIKAYGLFYMGLRDKAFYWEVILQNFRKIVFIIAGALLTSKNTYIKVWNFANILIGTYWYNGAYILNLYSWLCFTIH